MEHGDLKIAVFAYDFPHYKTQQGLLNLCIHGLNPVAVFVQKKKELKGHQSLLRMSPRRINLLPTDAICKALGLAYYNWEHDGREATDFIIMNEIDLGIVLGARILKKKTIDCFNIGIINMHPGILPINRGLDNPKWAIIDHIKQGVTVHLIDDRIDMGKTLLIETIDVFEDDTLADIYMRLQELELLLMIEAVNKIKGGNRGTKIQESGKYNRACTMEDESLLLSRFEYYKRYYSKMRMELK